MLFRSFKTLLPPNATELEKAVEESCFRSTNLEAAIHTLWNPGKEEGSSLVAKEAEACPVDLLPYLAWALGIEIWNSAWSEEEKRWIIKKYLHIRRVRGTLEALKLAYEALGVSLVVKEWWEEGFEGERRPYWFEVNLYIRSNSVIVNEENRKLIRWMTDRLKPLRSQYDLNIVFTMESFVGAACIARVSKICKLKGELRLA